MSAFTDEDVERARIAVKDECGSRICIRSGYDELIRGCKHGEAPRMDFCFCEDAARAALTAGAARVVAELEAAALSRRTLAGPLAVSDCMQPAAARAQEQQQPAPR